MWIEVIYSPNKKISHADKKKLSEAKFLQEKKEKDEQTVKLSKIRKFFVKKSVEFQKDYNYYNNYYS